MSITDNARRGVGTKWPPFCSCGLREESFRQDGPIAHFLKILATRVTGPPPETRVAKIFKKMSSDCTSTARAQLQLQTIHSRQTPLTHQKKKITGAVVTPVMAAPPWPLTHTHHSHTMIIQRANHSYSVHIKQILYAALSEEKGACTAIFCH